MAVPLTRVMRNFNNRIEEPVRKHLRNVYGCLTMSAASAALGVYLNITTRLISAGFLSMLASIGLALSLHLTPPNGKNNNLRLGFLLGLSFFSGVGIGPLVNFAMIINPSLILSALMATVLIFSCFTLCVLFSPRGYWLFLAGPISTILSSLFFLSLGNIFFQSQLLYQVNIYVGLLAMCGYVIYDTTLIMEKCRMNDKDFISHSLYLFMDFIIIFKKILIILLEKEERQNSRSKNK